MINDGINLYDLDTHKKRERQRERGHQNVEPLNKDFQSNSLKSSQGVNWGGLNTKCHSTSF